MLLLNYILFIEVAYNYDKPVELFTKIQPCKVGLSHLNDNELFITVQANAI